MNKDASKELEKLSVWIDKAHKLKTKSYEKMRVCRNNRNIIN